MNGLEKILEEIDLYIEAYNSPPYGIEVDGTTDLLAKCASIIRKHTTDAPDNDGWTPVEERMPENAKHKGSFCTKYQVSTKFGVTEGWYNSDTESWHCIFWFLLGRYEKVYDIEMERGDKPRVVIVPNESGIVKAWRPLPEPY